MPYIKAPIDRDQMMMTSYNDLVDPESMARVIDYFVNCLDLSMLGFNNTKPSEEGRPSYPPSNMLKLYLYGYRNDLRSSRKLEKGCKVNIELIWLVDGMQPDFRTISDFRKDNIDSLKGVFREFTRRITVDLKTGVLSVDGSKFDAWNGKDRNFTITKLDDRIKWLEDHSQEYLRLIEIADAQEELADKLKTAEVEGRANLSKEEIETKYKEAQERLERYRGYREYMEENNLTQLSLTDYESRLMKNKNGMEVSFNVQTAVDTETHMILDYTVTNQVTDHGMLAPTLDSVKAERGDEIIHGIADKGYQKDEDMIACLEKGIVPHVILPDGKDSYELEVEYTEAECDPDSTASEELKKCLHAGVVPEAYKEFIEDMEVKEVRRLVSDEPEESPGSAYGTEDEMRARALEGNFVRDPERDLVYCPGGQTLRRKCIKKNGVTRYANKPACAKCPYRGKCFSNKARWKEVDFSKDCLEKKAKWFEDDKEKESTAFDGIPKDEEEKIDSAAGKKVGPRGDETHDRAEETSKRRNRGHFEKRKVVRFKLKPNRAMMDKRKCTSEHPFGTIKQWLGSGFFLLKGLRKTDGEFALFGLSYNMARAENMYTFQELMTKVGG